VVGQEHQGRRCLARCCGFSKTFFVVSRSRLDPPAFTSRHAHGINGVDGPILRGLIIKVTIVAGCARVSTRRGAPSCFEDVA